MKRFGFLILALVLMLGTMGVAYSKWTDTINLNASVDSGNVCISWQTATNLDDCAQPISLDPNLLLPIVGGKPTYHLTDKDVACMSVTGIGTHTLTVTVENAYPLYYGDIEVEFCNCGTIPVKLQSIVIVPHDFVLAPFNLPWNPDLNPPGGCKPLWVVVTDGIGTQLDPMSWCEAYEGDPNAPGAPNCCKAASVKFVVQECAAQGATYTFDITWTVVQWNEFSTG